MTPVTNGVSLTEKAMLVSLSISSWQGRKLDKTATKKVQVDNGAADGTGRYHKNTVAKEALKDIAATIGAARTFHYANTLPWNDLGQRILPSANFLPYTEEMRKLKTNFENAVMKFVADYPQHVQEARALLGTMYNSEDYPQQGQIAGRFAFEFYVDPIPNAGDFRVTLQSDEVNTIQAQITARVEAAQTAAIGDLWDRLKEVLGKVEERLSDPEAIFRDSLIDNMVELTELVPRLNFTNDRKLSRTVSMIEDRINTLDPSTLRNNLVERKAAAKDAKAILDIMAGYCGN
jgi:hypothetical protein